MGSSASCSNKKATKVIKSHEKGAENIPPWKASRMLDDQRIVLDKKEKFLMKKIQDETVHFKQCMSVKNKQGKTVNNKIFLIFLTFTPYFIILMQSKMNSLF